MAVIGAPRRHERWSRQLLSPNGTYRAPLADADCTDDYDYDIHFEFYYLRIHDDYNTTHCVIPTTSIKALMYLSDQTYYKYDLCFLMYVHNNEAN